MLGTQIKVQKKLILLKKNTIIPIIKPLGTY